MADRLRAAATPLFCVLAGAVFFVAAAVGGHPGLGASMAVLMAVAAVGFWAAGRRSETVQGLMDHHDERLRLMDLQATAFTGLVLIFVVLAMFVVELALGHDGQPYDLLGAVAGIAYIAAVVWRRVRG